MGLGRGIPRTVRRHGKAVSPIVAVLLLVAISVVLAAVLYAIAVDETRASVTVPIGTALAAGPASSVIVGTAASNAFCQKSHYCYSIPIDEAGSGLTIGDLNLRVLAATGSPHIVSKNFAKISIVDLKNGVVASTQISKNSAFVVTDWQTLAAGESATTPMSDQQAIWVQFGNTATSPAHAGYSLEILGVGTFSGSIGIALP
jgi:flagellin-like protein